MAAPSLRVDIVGLGRMGRRHATLVHFGLPVIDYVVTHELAHLREMHHGPAFWDVVRSVLPEYEVSRAVLRSDPLPPLD